MGEPCPSCGKGELTDLVPGIKTCSVCRKIFRTQIDQVKVASTEHFGIQEGEYFNKHTTLNPQWEIAESGITVAREINNWWIAVLLCHTPSFPDTKYLRISWWKKAINAHGGMFHIEDFEELENVIIALQRFEADFDDTFNPKPGVTISYSPLPSREKYENLQNVFDENAHLCTKCGFKMKKSQNKRYYECERCGEIIILEEGKPVFDVPSQYLPLNYSSNFPINFYLPGYGITVKIGMADWKALVTVYSKENPEKKWLRFYWWRRDLQEYMTSQYTFGLGQGLRWEARKGALSPNIYQKDQLPKLIDALQQMKREWQKIKGIDPNVETNSTSQDLEIKPNVSKKHSKKSSKKKTTLPQKGSTDD